jgi:DSF synthase
MVEVRRDVRPAKDNLRVLTVGGQNARQSIPGFPEYDLPDIDLRFDGSTRALWAFLKSNAETHFSLDLIQELTELRRLITRHLLITPEEQRTRFLVFGSRIPGIFNLGGDLQYFAELIRLGTPDKLRHYAFACIEAIYLNLAQDPPVISIALVQGDALGGGFECALSFDVIVAERRARFGLPEILFNLFPGMGAYSLLSRRVGPRVAEKIILSGKVYTAQELHDLGVVDHLIDDGSGQAGVEEYIAAQQRTYRAQQAVYGIRKYVSNVTWEELEYIAERWVETALKLEESDLRRMLHLALAQKRRRARHAHSVP